MSKNKDIENVLLHGSTYDEVVKSKLEQDFQKEIEDVNFEKTKEEITEIKDVPKGFLFSKSAIFEVMNKNSKTKSYINGIQAEGYLGTQNSDRTKLLAGETNSFISGSSFVKFLRVKI